MTVSFLILVPVLVFTLLVAFALLMLKRSWIYMKWLKTDPKQRELHDMDYVPRSFKGLPEGMTHRNRATDSYDVDAEGDLLGDYY